jgi:hypothetical protein
MEENYEPPSIERSLLLTIMIFAQILVLGMLIVWAVLYFFALLSAKTDTHTLGHKVFLFLFNTYPFYSMGFMFIGWIAYFFRQNWVAWIMAILQFPPFIYLLYEVLRASL